MTNPASEATNSDVAHLINDAKQSSFVMEYISNFQPEDIDSDDIDLRFEADGVDTGCDVSIVDQCGKAATQIDALIAALEQAQHDLNAANGLIKKIKSNSWHVDTSEGAFIPNSLDAWGRPVPQYLPYDFSGNPGASATQYCNGWNDSGGYWLNHVRDLEERLRAAMERPESAPNGMMQLSNELAEMKKTVSRLRGERDTMLRDRLNNMESRPPCVKSNDAMREAASLCVKLPDSSSKAFWSGIGKTEQFHPETYKRWVKEAIERAGDIAGIQVEVK